MHLNCVDGTTPPLTAALHLRGEAGSVGNSSGRAQLACKSCYRGNKKVSIVIISGDEPPSLTDRWRRRKTTIHFPSARISARVDAACCMATRACQSSADSTVSKFAVGRAERPTGAARMHVLAITAPSAERRASTCPGRAGAMACE
jgi:hypothetical protein